MFDFIKKILILTENTKKIFYQKVIRLDLIKKIIEAIQKWLAKFQCFIISISRYFLGKPPSIKCWLQNNTNIANSIKWQFKFETSAYDIPETAKKPWPNWSYEEKAQLQSEFDKAWNWYAAQSSSISSTDEGLIYPPINQKDTTNDLGSPWTGVEPSYAWELFIHWIAFQFVVELGNHLPWSIRSYNDEQLQALFDSASIMSRAGDGIYTIGTGSAWHTNYVHREDNRGMSLIAPPRYTHAFLVNNALIGASKLETIGNLLQWISDNCIHFYGNLNYQEMDNHWQYRGIPPITRIIEGTTNTTLTSEQFQHWTAGCHGTAGFIRNVLRVANIPIHITIVCGHSQVCFITEAMYLDHGDNPYNTQFKSTGLPALDLLVDESTYVSWFGVSTDNRSEGCDKIGHQVDVLANP